MIVPQGMSEPEVLEIIDRVAVRLCRKFKFGYHDVDDMKQQAKLFALECMDSETYDSSRPLENFLWTHVRNRLFNMKRNKYERPDKPCFTCPLYDPHCRASTNECEAFPDKMECTLYHGWINRNAAKKNLMCPIDLGEVRDEHEDNMKVADHVEEIGNKEIWDLIDKHLEVGLRADYIKIKNGIKVPKNKRTKVEEAIIAIMHQYGGLESDD